MKYVFDGSDVWVVLEYWFEGQIRSVQLMECDIKEL